MVLSQRQIPSLLLSAAALAASLTAYSPVWFGASTFSGMDFTHLILPQYVWGSQHLWHHGQWPLWNPLHWSGSPHLAAMQSMPLYAPAQLMGLLLPPIRACHMLILVHLIWLGWGGGHLARQMGANLPGSLLPAVSLPVCGFVFGHLEQVNTVAAFSWTPWIMSGCLRLRSLRQIPLVALTISLGLLAGHPHYIVLASCGAVFLALAWWSGSLPLRQRNRSHALRIWYLSGLFMAGRLVMAFGLAFLLAAPQLLPAWELSRQSERIWPYDPPDLPRLDWGQIPNLILPRYLNHLAGQPGRPLGHTESGLFLGPLPLLAAAFVLIALSRGQLREATRLRASCLALLLTATVAFLYGLGRQTPVFDLINTIVPTLASSRGSARANLVGLISLLTLSAVGLSLLWAAGNAWAARRIPGPWRRWGGGLVLGTILITQIAVATWAHRPEFIRRLVPVQALISPGTKLDRTPYPLAGTGRIHRFMRDDSNYYLDDRPTAVRERILRKQPGFPMLHGIATTDGYEEGLLPTLAYANFLRRWNRNLRQEKPDPLLLGVLGAEHLLTDYPLPSHIGLEFGPMSPLSVGRDLRTYAVLSGQGSEPALASFFPATQTAALQQALETLSGPQQTDSHGRPLRVNTGRNPLALKFPEGQPVPLSWQPNRMTLEWSAPTTGTLVIRSQGYPGWQRENGPTLPVRRFAAPIMTTDVTPEGPPAHAPVIMTFVFRPYSFRVGLFLGLVSGFTCMVLWMQHRPTGSRPVRGC
jgi:hypothetical protein